MFNRKPILDGNQNHDDLPRQNQHRIPNGNNGLSINPFHLEVVREGDRTKLIPCGNTECNKVNAWERTCYKCDSDDNPKCKNDLDNSMTELCPFADEDLGCFHMIIPGKTFK